MYRVQGLRVLGFEDSGTGFRVSGSGLKALTTLGEGLKALNPTHKTLKP